MFLHSIRWRLQVWHGVLLVLVLSGFGLTAYQLQRANQFRRIDQELQQRWSLVAGALRRPAGERPGRRFGEGPGPHLNGLPPLDPREESEGRHPPLRPPPEAGQTSVEERPADPGGSRPPAPGVATPRFSTPELTFFNGDSSNRFYYVAWSRFGRLLSRSDTGPATIPQPQRQSQPNETRTRDTFREIFHYTPPGECILVGKDIQFELAEMRRFAGLLLGAGSAVLAFGLAGGWWLSSRAIRPIQDISATAAKISGGDLTQRINVSETESELGRLAGVLNSTFARLDAAFSQQRQFTSDAAHELRTPVSVMLTQTQTTLNRERSAAEYRETVESCQRAAQRMKRLIESLLELARFDAGQEKIEREPFDLAETARKCIADAEKIARERNIRIVAELNAAQTNGDPARIAQVITNLLTNAIHYNKEGGEVRVSTSSENGAAMLRVKDTGQGIGPEALPHIFERFYRADSSRTGSSGRSGLGLAISKAIIDARHGTISAESFVGQGTTFTVRI